MFTQVWFFGMGSFKCKHVGQIPPRAHLFIIYILSIPNFELQLNSWVAVMETLWLMKL